MKKQPAHSHDVIDRDNSVVHDWRTSQLIRLGIPTPLAELYADFIDWHQIARLVGGGCPPLLALRIVWLPPREEREPVTVLVNWRDDAACRETDVDLFFPIGTTGPALLRVAAAKRVCRACPVQPQCLAWALDYGVSDGVWGGATADERRVIRRRLTEKGTGQAAAGQGA